MIVDETADIDAAVQKVTASKCFDNATSCSSENVLIVADAIYDRFIEAIEKAVGRLLAGATGKKLKDALFVDGHLNRQMLARDIDEVIGVAEVEIRDPNAARFLMIEGDGIGPDFPESGEKLSLIATIYRARDFAHATEFTSSVLDFQGAGHSVGLHTAIDARAVELGHELPTCRVIVNQAHCFATGGSFDNGMPFSLSMGCGSWGGNSIDDNFNHTHLMNITKVVRTIAVNEPSLESIFGDYWQWAGK